MEREALKLALEAMRFALHVGFDESSESQIKKGFKAYQQHEAAIASIKETLAQPAQRTWVGLTRKQFAEILCDDRLQGRPELMILQTQAMLKEKNT